jgi:hypothetical protein
LDIISHQNNITSDTNIYLGSVSNGVISADYGWFPRGMEFKSYDTSFCSNMQPIILGLITLFWIVLVFLQPPKWLFFFTIILSSSLYITFTAFIPGEYV